MDNAKSLFISKTFWFNLGMGIYNVLETVGVVALIPQPFGALFQSAVNIGLRVITGQPVKLM